MLRRSARSAGIAPRKEDADHGVEPENEVEARGHGGRRDVEEADAEEGTAGEGDRKEHSIWEENEGPGDSGADAGVGGGHGTEYVVTGAGALADDVCDDCAIKDSTILGTWSRLRVVRQALVRTRQELAELRSKQSSGGKAEVTQSVNQVATLQMELANSNAALSRAEGAVEELRLLARRENLAKQQAEDKAGLAAVERDEALARATVAERALARADGATAPQQLRRPLEVPVVTDPSVATTTMQQPGGVGLGATMTAGTRETRLASGPAEGLVPELRAHRGARYAATAGDVVGEGAALEHELGVHGASLLDTGAVEKAEAGAASPAELAFSAHVAVRCKTDALGDRWRGSGAAKRPREPGGAQGLTAAVAVAYGVVEMAVMGAVPGSGYSWCITRSGVADVPSGRRSGRSAVEAKGTALLDEVSMLRLAGNRVGEVGVDAGGDGRHLGWWCAMSAEQKQPKRVRCRGYCCGGAGGAANGGAGHARAEKLQRFGWRRICRGGAANGGAGHARAEKLKRFGWRRIGRGGAAVGGAGHTRAEKLRRFGWRRICRGGAAVGGAGHSRAEKLKRFGWRRSGRGGAAVGGAGLTRAEKLERFGWRRISRGGAAGGAGHTRTGAAVGGAGHARAEKLKRFGWRRIGRGGAAVGGAGHTREIGRAHV